MNQNTSAVKIQFDKKTWAWKIPIVVILDDDLLYTNFPGESASLSAPPKGTGGIILQYDSGTSRNISVSLPADYVGKTLTVIEYLTPDLGSCGAQYCNARNGGSACGHRLRSKRHYGRDDRRRSCDPHRVVHPADFRRTETVSAVTSNYLRTDIHDCKSKLHHLLFDLFYR